MFFFTNRNPDSVIKISIFRSIYGQTSLALQSIKLAEAMIDMLLACAAIGASKLSFFKPLRTGTT